MIRRSSERGSTTAAALGVVAAVITLITAVLGLVPSLRPWQSDGPSTPGADSASSPSVRVPTEVPSTGPDAFTPASIYLNAEGGPEGKSVKVSGEGFSAGEKVELRFHTTRVGTTTANADGKFSNVSVVIPTGYAWSAPEQYDIVATGRTSSKSADAPYNLTG